MPELEFSALFLFAFDFIYLSGPDWGTTQFSTLRDEEGRLKANAGIDITSNDKETQWVLCEQWRCWGPS